MRNKSITYTQNTVVLPSLKEKHPKILSCYLGPQIMQTLCTQSSLKGWVPVWVPTLQGHMKWYTILSFVLQC